MISVIVPAFNDENTIGRALKSVIQQAYKDFEIIVVDDGSTDNTGAVVQKFGDRISYFYQDNAGPASARNTALEHANREWLAFLDADDEWLPEKLEKQMELLGRNPQLKWCCTNRYQSDGRKKTPVGNESKIRKALGNKNYFENYFLAAANGRCPIITSCLVVRKDVFEELGGFNPEYLRGQDIDMWWRIAHRYPQIGYVPEPLAIRHLDSENPLTKQRRLEAAKGESRRKLIAVHCVLAKESNNAYDFKKYAKKQLVEGVIRALYFGHITEAKIMVDEFRHLLKLPVHLTLITLILLAPVVKIGLSLFFKLTGNTARK